MSFVLAAVLGGSAALLVYTYLGYPLLLMCLGALRRKPREQAPLEDWPTITISIPAHDEERTIAATLDRVLQLDYPSHLRQVLVISDASEDGTDAIVRGYASRGVELLRLDRRVGKTAAENAARSQLRGEIIVNTDASVRIDPSALKPLISCFADPTVGLASGRDVSVARVSDHATLGESGYVGYEMWVRDLETRVSGIVGASGCLYAIRRDLQMEVLPANLSRDFAAALISRENGYRAVSVPDAVCFVPRASSLRREYSRKVRTMTRGLETLWHKRHLLNPFRYGVFSWMLFSHKLCRWLVPWSLALAAVALAILSLTEVWARFAVAGIVLAGGLAALGWAWSPTGRLPRPLAIPAYIALGNLAALYAWLKALGGEGNPIWEPTRRESFRSDQPAGDVPGRSDVLDPRIHVD